MSSSTDSTPEGNHGTPPSGTTNSQPASPAARPAQPGWQRRLPLAICLLVLAYWYFKPPSGAGFMRVPIPRVAAPSWSLTNLNGQRLDASSLTGKVVVLNFWATFCPPCIREIPDLAAFHLAHSNDAVAVVGLSLDTKGPEAVRSVVQKLGIPYPVAMADAAIAEAFGGVAQIPSTFVIAPDGTFAARYLGALTREELERVLAEASRAQR